jgi:hypothetical protein
VVLDERFCACSCIRLRASTYSLFEVFPVAASQERGAVSKSSTESSTLPSGADLDRSGKMRMLHEPSKCPACCGPIGPESLSESILSYFHTRVNA